MSYRDGYIIKHPGEIGGRATDLSQIAYTIEREVKMAFPANQVPTLYIIILDHLKHVLTEAEDTLQRAVEVLREDGTTP